MFVAAQIRLKQRVDNDAANVRRRRTTVAVVAWADKKNQCAVRRFLKRFEEIEILTKIKSCIWKRLRNRKMEDGQHR
jgi:hypothetical protein